MKKNRQRKSRLGILLAVLVLVLAGAAGAADCEYAVSLRLEPEQLSNGTRFWLTGSVDPFKVGSTGQTVRLSIVGPQGRVVFDGNVALDAKGSYRYAFHFQQDAAEFSFHLWSCVSAAGLYHVCVSYGGASCEALIPVLPPVGSAIVVAGYGGDAWNPVTRRYEDLQKPVNALAEYAYTVLRWSRNLPGDRIYFLHPDLATDCDLDGQPDVDALPSAENLKSAIEDWALDKLCAGQEPGLWHSPLTIYVVSASAVSDIVFLNDNDPVSADNLASWLGTLKAGLDQQPMEAGLPICPSLPATVILECQMSGSFIDNLAAANPGLTIVTSSGDGTLGYGQCHIAEAGGMLSFGHELWNRILRGGSLPLAWYEAKQFILDHYGDQKPQLYTGRTCAPGELLDDLLPSQQYLRCSGTGGFSVCGELGFAVDGTTFTLAGSCVVGESAQIRARVQHTLSVGNCTVYVVAFPPAGVTVPNIIHELAYSQDLQKYVQTLRDGFAAPGKWELLYVAVDADGRIAVTSGEVVVLPTDVVPPIPPGAALGATSDYTVLLNALAGATPSGLDRMVEIIGQAATPAIKAGPMREGIVPPKDIAPALSHGADLIIHGLGD
jgi:hypothetical protein